MQNNNLASLHKRKSICSLLIGGASAPWATPIIKSVVLPAHGSATSDTPDAVTTPDMDVITLICPTETSRDVIVTAGDIQIYTAGVGTGIWWSTIGPVPDGHVAFNLLPTVFGVQPGDVIFWDVSFDGGSSFSDIANFGISNGQTTVNQ